MYIASVEDILEAVDDATDPSLMSKVEAVKFLENLSTEIECRLGAFRDEIRALDPRS